MYVCIGYSSIWKEPIHKILKKLRNKFDLRWLRISMSYHRSPNMREMLAGDLSKKLSKGVESFDFKVRDCNCRGERGPDTCQYRNYCRMPIVIYRITCKLTNKIYIDNTQQHFKMRMRGHFQDVKWLMEKGVHSDSYTRHFTGIWPRGAEIPTPGMQRDRIKCEILWQGNPTSELKTFGKNTCDLCNREQMEIIKISRKPPIYLSTPARRYMARGAITNPDSIGTTNRKAPVLMITRSVKKLSWRPQTRLEEEST
jgi:hypothetical protein